MAKKTKEAWKIYKNVFDDFTIKTIMRLIGLGVFEGLESPIKIGKESNIFSAKTKEGTDVIVKIYRLESCNFNKMFDYLKSDPRFASLKRQRRQIIFTWVQREYRNIMKAMEAGVRVPMPLAVQNNVLVLEYIGDDEPAPQLKDSVPVSAQAFLDQILANLNRLYHGAGLVHGDLSAFNILNYNDNPVLIDFSQGTAANSSNAEELMDRDLVNLAAFFEKRGLQVDIPAMKKKILAKPPKKI